METVWLHANSQDWHVEVGSETYRRLLAEGAVEVDDPTAKPAAHGRKPAAKGDEA